MLPYVAVTDAFAPLVHTSNDLVRKKYGKSTHRMWGGYRIEKSTQAVQHPPDFDRLYRQTVEYHNRLLYLIN